MQFPAHPVITNSHQQPYSFSSLATLFGFIFSWSNGPFLLRPIWSFRWSFGQFTHYPTGNSDFTTGQSSSSFPALQIARSARRKGLNHLIFFSFIFFAFLRLEFYFDFISFFIPRCCFFFFLNVIIIIVLNLVPIYSFKLNVYQLMSSSLFTHTQKHFAVNNLSSFCFANFNVNFKREKKTNTFRLRPRKNKICILFI